MRTWQALSIVFLPVMAAVFAVLLGSDSWPLAIGAGGAVALATGLASRLSSRWRKEQIGRLEGVISAVSAGDFQARAGVPDDRELERLSRSVDEGIAQYTTRLRELSDRAQTLSAVLDGMAEGVWVTDAEGNLTRHNLALKEMLYAGQDLVGQRPLALLRSTVLSDAVMRACEQGESTQLEVTVEGVRPRLLSVRVAPLGQSLSGSTAVFHDITELRRLENVRKDFVANVSHELRTPITAIRGYAETLKGGALADREHAPQMVEIIHRQSERLSELVEDLLELSRLESRDLQLETSQVPLGEAAQRAADAVRPKATGKSIRVDLQIPSDLRALGDERGVEQVLLNLLDNAVKYTPAGGRVEVTGRLEDGRAVLAIKDTGIGIAEKHLPRIFERFYRVDKGRSRDMGGTGLGLSIVKHLLGAMKGDVRVASRPGEGTTFTLFLPAAPRDGAMKG